MSRTKYYDKDGNEIDRKAAWYLDREIKRINSKSPLTVAAKLIDVTEGE